MLLVRDNQITEEQIFGNEHSTPAFENFLEILGTKVELQGFTGFSAGLDTKSKWEHDFFPLIWAILMIPCRNLTDNSEIAFR